MLALLQLLLPEVAAHHRVAVLVDPIDEVLAGFQEKSLNPLYVRAKTLFSPIPPALRLSRHSPARFNLLPVNAMQLPPELLCSVPTQVDAGLQQLRAACQTSERDFLPPSLVRQQCPLRVQPDQPDQ